MVNETVLNSVATDTILINAARGAVVDNDALESRLKKNPEQKVVLDTWEGEPEINLDLLGKVSIATPHIAGYSREGKLNGTRMVRAQYNRFFSLEERNAAYAEEEKIMLETPKELPPLAQLNLLIKSAYNIMKDHDDMKKLMHAGSVGVEFDKLRKTYPLRREFSAFTTRASEIAESIHDQAMILGFSLNS
jgi:erythronate-4-phosphate dehydrogenase